MLIEKESGTPDFWQNPGEANQVMRQLSALKEETQNWRELEQRVST